jgi:hypothetical protein
MSVRFFPAHFVFLSRGQKLYSVWIGKIFACEKASKKNYCHCRAGGDPDVRAGGDPDVRVGGDPDARPSCFTCKA